MIDPNDRLPIGKPNPMKTTDWILLGILIVLFATTFPFLWWVYRPLLWFLFRFMLPIAIFIFIGYFALRALKLGENTTTDIEGNFVHNLRNAWMETWTWVRKYFKSFAITFIALIVIFCGSVILYTKFSKRGETEKQMARMKNSIEKYKNHTGNYPSNLSELIGNDPLKREWLKDSWGNSMDYTLTHKGFGFRLSSSGADGEKGNGDDLVVEGK